MRRVFASAKNCWIRRTFLAFKPYSQNSAQALLRRVRACDLCADHLPLGPRPVFQFGASAPTLLVGQAPGTASHNTRTPFSDPSGERLRGWLGVASQSFYNPSHFALLPMGFCYPGKGSGGDLPPRPECARHWRHQLLARLTNVQLTLLVGAHAVRWHLNKPGRSLSDLTRDWESRWPHTVVLPHPSPRNTRWLQQRPWVEKEIVPAVQQRVAALLAAQA